MFRLLSCSLFCLSSVGHVLVLSAEPLSRSLPLIVKLIALNEWLSGLTAPLRHTLYLLSRFNLVSAPRHGAALCFRASGRDGRHRAGGINAERTHQSRQTLDGSVASVRRLPAEITVLWCTHILSPWTWKHVWRINKVTDTQNPPSDPVLQPSLQPTEREDGRTDSVVHKTNNLLGLRHRKWIYLILK